MEEGGWLSRDDYQMELSTSPETGLTMRMDLETSMGSSGTDSEISMPSLHKMKWSCVLTWLGRKMGQSTPGPIRPSESLEPQTTTDSPSEGERVLEMMQWQTTMASNSPPTTMTTIDIQSFAHFYIKVAGGTITVTQLI